MSLLKILALGMVTVMVTTGCNGKTRPSVKIKTKFHMKKSKLNGNGDSGCLQIGILLGELQAQSDEAVLVYTSDLQLGSPRGEDSDDGVHTQFVRADISSVNAAYFLHDKKHRPVLLKMDGKELSSSVVGDWLSARVDSACKRLTVTLGGEEKIFSVTQSTSDFLAAENDDQFITIKNVNSERVEISTHFSSASDELCGREVPPTARVTYSVAWGDQLDDLYIYRYLGELYAKYLPKSPELLESLEDKPKRIKISLPTYEKILESIDDGSVKAKCTD